MKFLEYLSLLLGALSMAEGFYICSELYNGNRSGQHWYLVLVILVALGILLTLLSAHINIRRWKKRMGYITRNPQ